MYPIKQSTAITIPFFVHDVAGDAVTGLVDAGFTKRISKGSGAFAAMTVTITEMENGWYSIPLSTTHSDTLGLLTILFTHASAKQVNLQFRVEASILDDLATATDLATVDTVVDGIQTDLDNGADGLGAIKGDTAAILVDTGTTLDGRIPAALVGGRMDANVGAISGDAAAADNLELDYDGTGYAKANSTIGTTTANTDMRGTDSAALASVLGALADAAAAGDPTASDTVVQYLKQLVNVLVGTTGVTTFPAEAAPANNVSLAEVLRAVHADVTGLAGAAMRGTDNAALASVVGALADAAAAGDPTASDTLIAYVKQLVNTLEGTAGLPTYPAAAVPGNAVSLAEILRQVYDEVAGIDGAAMRGTDSAALASVATEARLSELDAATGGKAANQIDLIKTEADKIGTPAGASVSADIAAVQSDADDIQTRLPAALVTGRMSSDAVAISGSTDAADRLEASAETIVTGAAIAGTLSTTQMTTNLTEASDDHFNGRILIWTSGALKDQATDITDYAGASKMLTYTAVTEAPVATDTFVIM